MTAPGALLKPLQKPAALANAAVVLDQRRQGMREALVETGQQMGGVILQLSQIQPDLQHRPVGPHIRAAQVVDAQQLDVFFLAH
jgi:hypothetical protein